MDDVKQWYEDLLRRYGPKRGPKSNDRLSRHQLFKLHAEASGPDALSEDKFNQRYHDFAKAQAFAEPLGRAIEQRFPPTDAPAPAPPDHTLRRKQGSYDQDTALHLCIEKALLLKPALQRAFGEQIHGRFQFWRYSTDMPGYFTKGYMSVAKVEVAKRTCIIVSTVQRLTPAASDHAVEAKVEQLSGYLFPVEPSCCVMLARGVDVVGFRMAIFKKIERDAEENILNLMGHVMGLTGSNAFTSPIYLERVPKADRHDDANVYPEKDVPEKIRAILKRAPLLEF